MAEATSYTVAGHTAVHTGPDTLVGTLVGSRMLVGVDNKEMPLEPVDAELDRVLKLVPVLILCRVVVELVPLVERTDDVKPVDNIGDMPSAGDSYVPQRAAPLATWAVEERTDMVAAGAVVDNTPSRVGCAGPNCNAVADGDGVPS